MVGLSAPAMSAFTRATVIIVKCRKLPRARGRLFSQPSSVPRAAQLTTPNPA